MEIKETTSTVSAAGILFAALWLLVLLPLAVVMFGWLGFFGAILAAIATRAMRPKRFTVVDQTHSQP